MSIQAVGWVLDHERDTTGTTRLVLLALANYANTRGDAWPSVKTLAADCNCSDRQVQYSLGELVNRGVLSKLHKVTDPRYRADRRPYIYRLNGVHSLHLAASRGEVDGVNGVQSATERGEDVFTQSIKEPSKNRQRRRQRKSHFIPGTGWVEERA